MSFYNPFSDIIETKLFPHARTLRTSFIDKVLDAFFIFAGNPDPFPSSRGKNRTERHVGLFDYVTLGIPHILFNSTILMCEPFEKKLRAVIFFITFIIHAPLFIVRCAFAGILTFISLPVIIGVHCVALIQGKDLREKVLQLPIHRMRHIPEGQDSYTVRGIVRETSWIEENTMSLGRYLKINAIEIEDLTYENISMHARSDDENRDLVISFSHEDSQDRRCKCCVYQKPAFTYQAVFSKSNIEFKKNLQGILDLNICGITAELENEDRHPGILPALTSGVNHS